ncbi:MAG: 5-carboxymethyl-2-hydroxymuconate Delta-isomerase [Firmicutes bacterium]|nr:5-carboxymethyl-2-hydroxymuconate Delta-isomerase [Bacillota bacterium]
MKIVRFEHAGEIKFGILHGEKINVVTGDIFSDYQISEQVMTLEGVKLLSPCVITKAVCVGLNYRGHAQEMKFELPDKPLIFLKPSSTLNHPAGEIEYPTISHDLQYEAELAVVIKKQARNIKTEDAADYILGYTCANDVTARDIQKADGQWTRGKSFDTFLPLGPCIETDIDSNSINIKLYLNDELKQSSNTSDLIFKVPELVAFITEFMTLYPGDVILTGTPSGVGPMEVGDVVTVELEGIGKLSNVVI